MRLFRRATRGRHARGAAVISLPPGPRQELVAAMAAPAAAPHVMVSIAALIASGEAWSTEPPPPPAWRLPRVQLGFRDGSSASLDPSSSQSRALQALARSLTRRD